ncbi:MAG: DUF4160 domain-containing protein [Gemmatimonadetes bacterium]|nr:DUF4160 domain-containing protein [Gemmatimonadota bacterium]
MRECREFSGGGLEPRHVHVRQGGGEAKVWIDSLEIAESHGFSPAEERAVRKHVERNRGFLQRAWDEYFREPPGQSSAGDREPSAG